MPDAARLVGHLDLGLLAAALPIFLIAGLPIAGYAVCAVAWIAGRAIHLAAERRARSLLAAGSRRGALGTLAAATLARVWLITLAILIVGLAHREAGLAAAVLAAGLFTRDLAGQGVARLLEPAGGTGP
jgi:hypothetical protein